VNQDLSRLKIMPGMVGSSELSTSMHRLGAPMLGHWRISRAWGHRCGTHGNGARAG